MPNFDKPTGSASLLRIADNGSTWVDYLIYSGDPATFSGGVLWDGTINGSYVEGSRPINSGAGWYHCGGWGVSYSQTAHFNMKYTGTMGLGGPTNHSAWISRATIPPAPTPLEFQNISHTGMRARFSGNGNGGSAIIRWESQYSTSPTFASGNSGLITSNGTVEQTGLLPGTKYYWRHRGVNSLGNGAWSAITSATTLAGGRRKVGGVWVNAVRWRKVAGTWHRTRRWRKVAGTWVLTR